MCDFRIYILNILILLAAVSCEKNEARDADYIFNKWEVVDFMSVESMLYAKENDYNPLIEFLKDGTYLLKLDVNSCSGNFELLKNEGIQIASPGCTKMCCDSDFSKKLNEMLPQVESYSIEQNKLILDIPGWGWINLELNN